MKDMLKIVIDTIHNLLKNKYNAVVCYFIKAKTKIMIFFKICLFNSNSRIILLTIAKNGKNIKIVLYSQENLLQ